MKKGEVQLGFPNIVFTDTKANIEALSDVTEGAHAYATDTDEPGWYNGASWVWGAGSSSASFDKGARVYNNADQSVNDSEDTILAFNSEIYDTDTIHDTVTNNSRISIPS